MTEEVAVEVHGVWLVDSRQAQYIYFSRGEHFRIL